MFNIVSSALFALAVSSVTALVVPRGPSAPADWSSSLEDYAGYHARYMAVGCYAKHNDPFFDRCCHPLQNGVQPEPSCQSPSGADSSDNDDDCEDEDDSSLTVTPTTSPSTAEASPSTAKASPSTTKASPSTAKASPSTAKASPTATPHSSSAAKAKATDAAVNVDTNIFSGGVATFYFQGGNAGACGQYNSDNALIAAMDYRTYGDTSRKSPLCGKKVEITNTKNHKKVIVTVADACPTCTNSHSIDLSVHAFESIATKSEGEVPITWKFV